jgi:hypothetical protein
MIAAPLLDGEVVPDALVDVVVDRYTAADAARRRTSADRA